MLYLVANQGLRYVMGLTSPLKSQMVVQMMLQAGSRTSASQKHITSPVSFFTVWSFFTLAKYIDYDLCRDRFHCRFWRRDELVSSLQSNLQFEPNTYRRDIHRTHHLFINTIEFKQRVALMSEHRKAFALRLMTPHWCKARLWVRPEVLTTHRTFASETGPLTHCC